MIGTRRFCNSKTRQQANTLNNMIDNTLVIYHGSSEQRPHPIFGYGKTTNDYGRGFYCTESIEMAKEWACSDDTDGYVSKYEINTAGLSILYLNSKEYHILNWLSILLDNRTFNISAGIAKRAKEYIMQTFLPEYKSYDIIVGYRADDSYFSYANDFIDNTLSLENLSTAMTLGKLGEQVVIISEKAFNALTFIEATPVASKEYYEKYKQRDKTAREDYRTLKNSSLPEEGLYVMDIIRAKIQNDDTRLR